MSSDTARKIKEHLATLAQVAKYYRALAPEIDRQLQLAQWRITAQDALGGQHLPAEVLAQVEASLSDILRQVQKQLPHPQYPGNPSLRLFTANPEVVARTTSTESASGNIAILNVLVTVARDPNAAPVVKPILEDFEKLQEAHGRVGEARSRLRTVFPNLVAYFDAAEKSYGMAKLSLDGAPAAASDIRTLLIKLRAELIDKARRWPKENDMGWEEMAERLIRDRVSDKFRHLANQESQHSRISDELSPMLKARYVFDIDQLAALWPMAVEHVFVTCGCLME